MRACPPAARLAGAPDRCLRGPAAATLGDRCGHADAGGATAGPLASPTLGAATATPAPVATTVPVATSAPATDPPVTAPPPSVAPGIGTPVQIGDQQTVTVIGVRAMARHVDREAGKGKAFMTVSIRVDAIDHLVRLRGLQAARSPRRGPGGRAGAAPVLPRDMKPGSNYIGWVTYEVPKSALGSFELIYRPSFLPGRRT